MRKLQKIGCYPSRTELKAAVDITVVVAATLSAEKVSDADVTCPTKRQA